MPVNARYVLLLAFVHSSAFAAAIPLDPRRVSDTVIEDGTPFGVSNRYHHYAGARDLSGFGDSLGRSIPVTPRGISTFATASDATSGAANKVLGRRDPSGLEAAPAGPPGPPPTKAQVAPPPPPPPPMAGPPGPQGPPGPPGSGNPPYPYPYPYPFPFPVPEHEREREREHEHEFPHQFQGHEQFMEHEGERTMYHEYPGPNVHHYPHEEYSGPHDYAFEEYPHRDSDGFVRYHHFENLQATEFPHDEFRRPHDDFGPPRDHFPHSHEFFYGRPSEFEEERFSGQQISQHERVSGEHTSASEVGTGSKTDSKRPNSISVPSASSVDLASAKLPTRDNEATNSTTSAKSNSNDGPNISGLFSALGSRGDAKLEARENSIPLLIPSDMSLGKIEQRAPKGNEVNEVAVEDHRTNPVEKLVTL